MAYMGYDISRGLQKVLNKNGLEAHIEMDPDGRLYLAAEGRYYQYNRYEITEKQADILSRWLDMGTGSTNEKAYNTVKAILKDADMPQNLTMAQQAGGLVNMGQYGQRMTPERMGITPKQTFGGLYSAREMGPRILGGRRFGMWYPGNEPTFPGERLAPGTMRSFDYRSGGRLLPTTGVYQKAPEAGRMLPENNDLLDDIRLNAEVRKPVEAVYPKGQAKPFSELIMAETDAYFTVDKFREVMASHGIQIGEFNVDGQMRKGVLISNSASRVDKLFYALTDAEMAAMLNPSVNESAGGVSVQQRLDILNGKEGFQRDFSAPVTKEMLESREIIHIELTEQGKAEIEKDFLAYDEQQARQKMLAEAKEQARSDYMAEEGRIRRDPNAISGRDIAAVMGSCAWFNGTAHGREVVVGEIRVDAPKDSYFININTDKGLLSFNVDKSVYDRFRNNQESRDEIVRFLTEEYRQGTDDIIIDGEKAAVLKAEPIEVKGKIHTMSAVINGETVTMDISQKDYDKFLRYDDRHRLELFDKLCDKVRIDAVDPERYQGQGRPYDIFLTADGREIVTREQLEISRSQSVDVDGGQLKDLNYKKGFYMEGRHGREVNVENIRVEPDLQQEGKFKMTAVIDGKAITHDITQKQYDRFLACDDYQRLKLFSKVFNEVDMKIRPEHRPRFDAMLMAGLVGITDLARTAIGMAHGPGYGPHMPPPGPMLHPESVHFAPAMAPAVFEERIPGPAPHHTRAADLASAAFESEAGQQQSQGQSAGQGRSMG